MVEIEGLQQAEAAASKGESDLREIVDALPAMAWASSPGGAATFVNRSWIEHFGLSLDKISRWDWTEILHPDDAEPFFEKWRASLTTGEPLEGEARFRRSDGQYRWFLIRGVPRRDEQGNILNWCGVATDIEDRKRTEQKLRESEFYLAEAQRLARTGSWAWTMDAGIRYWSEECYRVLGFDSEDGLPSFGAFFQRIHPNDQAAFAELTDKAIREKAAWEADYRIVHPDGSVRDIRAVGHPVLTRSGGLVEFVGTVIDVTERKLAAQERERLRRLEAELAHANRLATLGQLAASLAHEMKQPLAAVVTNGGATLRWLTRVTPEINEAKGSVERMIAEAHRATDIVDGLRDLTRKNAIRKQAFDLNEAILGVTALTHSEALQNGITVRMELAPYLPHIEGDRVQLQQVMLNLIVNAIQAMGNLRDGVRELHISTDSVQSEGVCVRVHDTGPGLSPDNLGRLFEPLYTTKSDGMGMGLSICRSIVEAHGGQLWASANEPRGAEGPLTCLHATFAVATRNYRDTSTPAVRRHWVRCEINVSRRRRPPCWRDGRRGGCDLRASLKVTQRWMGRFSVSSAGGAGAGTRRRGSSRRP
jgi:PAS domain S-box-containing protein